MRRARSLGDLLLAALCLWAAWYHTPPGALLRTALARVFGSRDATPALLSYYGAGARTFQLAEPLPPRAALSPGAALGLGAQSALERASPADRAQVLARAGLRSGSADALGDWIGREAQRQGSREAAVLSLFCGEDAARFARDRAGAGRGGASLEELARELPPRYAGRVALAATALTLGTAYALAWPLPDAAQVTSPFGLRAHPLLGARRFHSGIDLGVPVGTPVRAAADGIVRRASDDRVSGRLVLVDHGSGVSTVYCHNEALLVAPGDAVTKGQVIALSGNSGLSTGPHLHYQLDLPRGPADPLLFRAARPPQLASGGTEP
jgi:murein DD-endopeptidase MepM/ murein hydrolase activator NlpD